MGKMRFGIAHRILSDAQAAEQKLKEFNRLLETSPLVGVNCDLQHHLDSAYKLNSDVVEEMTMHIEKLHKVLNEAWWWHRQIAKSLLIGISEEILKFQKIIVEHNCEKMIREQILRT